MLLAEAILGPILLSSMLAQSSGTSTQGATDQNSRQIDDMARRLDALEKRNAELQGQVVELKSQNGEQWLTEERAAEVRELVKDVLADSATRTSLQSNGATAGWDNGFFIASPDNRFRLEIGGLVQARWVWSSQRAPYTADGIVPSATQLTYDQTLNRSGFDVHNIELWAQGHVISPDIQYMLKGIFSNSSSTAQQPSTNGTNVGGFVGESTSGSFQLLDAWVRVNLTDDWSVRVGQFRAPYGREFLVLEQYQMAVDRSLVSLHYGMGYTQGLELEWLSNEARWRFSINDGGNDAIAGAGQVVGSHPLNSPWFEQQNIWGVTTRFDWKGSGGWAQFDQFTSPDGSEPGWLWGFAVNAQGTKPSEVYGQQQNVTLSNSSDTNTWVGLTTDFTMQFGGASLFASAYYNYVESNAAYYRNSVNTNVPSTQTVNAGGVNALGFTLQASAYLAPKWEVFSRYEYMHLTASNADALTDTQVGNFLVDQGHVSILTTGLNYYIDGQDAKVTADFGYGFTPIYPSAATPSTGWRASESDEFVVRAQMQLLF